jgi:hypothetical protein
MALAGQAGQVGGRSPVVVVILVERPIRMCLVPLAPAGIRQFRRRACVLSRGRARKGADGAPADQFFEWLSVKFKQGGASSMFDDRRGPRQYACDKPMNFRILKRFRGPPLTKSL